MRACKILVAGACAALAAALMPARVGAAPQPPYDLLEESYIVATRHGQMYVEIVRPTRGGEMVRGPAIFTYSPYSILGVPPHGARNFDASDWVPQGYVRAWADVVGTGNSGGCYDYGGIREKETAYDLVEWIADQEWSTGKVGMVGGSYEGTTATAAAVTDPPHLTTIVPEAAISRWYEYAYSGGVRYFINNESPTDEGVDTPLAFDFGLAIPPPVDATDEGWAERVASTVRPCDEIEHTQHGYDDTPDYDEFWLERDYIVDADNIDIPVLISHNWGDWNVKQEEAINLYRALTNSPNKKLYMGTRWSGHGTPGGDYEEVVHDWFDHYLMGVDNGIEDLDAVTSETSDYDGPLNFRSGPWPRTSKIKLFAQNDPSAEDYGWTLLPSRPDVEFSDETAAVFPSLGTNTEAAANSSPHENLQWFWFESPPLKEDTRIFGEIKVRLQATMGREWNTFTPTIVDYVPGSVNPHGPISATRGWLDSRYRDGRDHQVMVEPGESFRLTVVEKPQDYLFREGHQIALSVQTEINEWSLPKPYPCDDAECVNVRVDWERGKTQVILPVVGAVSPDDLFGGDRGGADEPDDDGDGRDDPDKGGDDPGGGRRDATDPSDTPSEPAERGALLPVTGALLPILAGIALLGAGLALVRLAASRRTP